MIIYKGNMNKDIILVLYLEMCIVPFNSFGRDLAHHSEQVD